MIQSKLLTFLLLPLFASAIPQPLPDDPSPSYPSVSLTIISPPPFTSITAYPPSVTFTHPHPSSRPNPTPSSYPISIISTYPHPSSSSRPTASICPTITQTLYVPCPMWPTSSVCTEPPCIMLKTVTGACPTPCTGTKTVTWTSTFHTCRSGCATSITTVSPLGGCHY